MRQQIIDGESVAGSLYQAMSRSGCSRYQPDGPVAAIVTGVSDPSVPSGSSSAGASAATVTTLELLGVLEPTLAGSSGPRTEEDEPQHGRGCDRSGDQRRSGDAVRSPQ